MEKYSDAQPLGLIYIMFKIFVKSCVFQDYIHPSAWTTHHGSRGWKGRFGDSLLKKDIVDDPNNHEYDDPNNHEYE